MDSILTSVKKIIGIAEEDESFDVDLIIHTNSVLMTLNQIGIGPKEGFYIRDKSAVWGDFITENTNMEAVKSYVGLRVRMIFDPPANGSVAEAIKATIAELEWRLYSESNYRKKTEVTE